MSLDAEFSYPETSDGVHVVDIWHRKTDVERFIEQRLMPAMQSVLFERGISLDLDALQPTFDEAYDVVRGR